MEKACATPMVVREKENFFAFKTPGSMGVVKDTHFKMCYWPRLEEPTSLFMPGSAGLIVQGPPTPRNVVFPPDTVFLNVMSSDGRLLNVPTRSDCFFVMNKEQQLVTEEREVTTLVEVEKGIVREVTYKKEIQELKEVEAIFDLNVASAELIAQTNLDAVLNPLPVVEAL